MTVPTFVRVGDSEFVSLDHVSRLFVLREALDRSFVWAAYAQLSNGTRVRLRHVEVTKPVSFDDVSAAGHAMREWLATFVASLAIDEALDLSAVTVDP